MLEKEAYVESLNVTKKFGDKEVLRGFSFKAEPSKVTFLAGKNGAGKTTWIRIATGLCRANSGKVIFGSQDINRVRNNFAIVLDEPPVYGHLSGYENLYLLSGRSKIDKVFFKDVISALGFDDYLLSRKTGEYSLGQRHRLAVAAAIMRKPAYLFLDEPSIGLDPVSWQLVRDLLKDKAKDGAIILVTGQDHKLMENFVDKIVILHNGVNVFEGNLKELRGKFPVKVKVRTQDYEKLHSLFPNDNLNYDRTKQIVEISCRTIDEAEKIGSMLSQSGIIFSELKIEEISLEDAFLSFIKN